VARKFSVNLDLKIKFILFTTMKAKYAICLLVFGYCLDFIGGLFKILHTAQADITLTVAAILKP